MASGFSLPLGFKKPPTQTSLDQYRQKSNFPEAKTEALVAHQPVISTNMIRQRIKESAKNPPPQPPPNSPPLRSAMTIKTKAGIKKVKVIGKAKRDSDEEIEDDGIEKDGRSDEEDLSEDLGEDCESDEASALEEIEKQELEESVGFIANTDSEDNESDYSTEESSEEEPVKKRKHDRDEEDDELEKAKEYAKSFKHKFKKRARFNNTDSEEEKEEDDDDKSVQSLASESGSGGEEPNSPEPSKEKSPKKKPRPVPSKPSVEILSMDTDMEVEKEVKINKNKSRAPKTIQFVGYPENGEFKNGGVMYKVTFLPDKWKETPTTEESGELDFNVENETIADYFVTAKRMDSDNEYFHFFMHPKLLPRYVNSKTGSSIERRARSSTEFKKIQMRRYKELMDNKYQNLLNEPTPRLLFFSKMFPEAVKKAEELFKEKKSDPKSPKKKESKKSEPSYSGEWVEKIKLMFKTRANEYLEKMPLDKMMKEIETVHGMFTMASVAGDMSDEEINKQIPMLYQVFKEADPVLTKNFLYFTIFTNSVLTKKFNDKI